FSGMTSSGITSTSHDVKLTTGGDLTIGQAVTLGTAYVTRTVPDNVTERASAILTAAGLQLMGAGSAHLDNGANDVTTLAASFNEIGRASGSESLTVGTVSDGFSGMTTSGITTTSPDVKLTAGSDLTIGQAVSR